VPGPQRVFQRIFSFNFPVTIILGLPVPVPFFLDFLSPARSTYSVAVSPLREASPSFTLNLRVLLSGVEVLTLYCLLVLCGSLDPSRTSRRVSTPFEIPFHGFARFLLVTVRSWARQLCEGL